MKLKLMPILVLHSTWKKKKTTWKKKQMVPEIPDGNRQSFAPDGIFNKLNYLLFGVSLNMSPLKLVSS